MAFNSILKLSGRALFGQVEFHVETLLGMAGQVNNVYKLFVEVDALVSELCVDHLPYAANGLIRRLEVVAIL
jgi:hypothetical protein